MTSRTQEFLRAILPDEGYKVAVIFNGTTGRPRQQFFTALPELETVLLNADGLGHTVYHACAAFKNPDSRKADNALGAKSFWADIDLAPKSRYATLQDAYAAVLEFCQRTTLPVPVFVGSGNGLHLYWPLDTLLDHGTWLRYAEALKALCVQHGLDIDPARTADIASILRTPGSHWRKADPPRIVEAGPIIGPYPLSTFDVLATPTVPVFPTQPRPISGQLFGINARVGMVYAENNPPADQVADHCEQIRMLRDNCGKVPEPHWHAAISVLRFCEDGLEKALEWSTGGFERQIEEKFHRVEKLSGPVTCAHFAKSINPAACARCPLFQHITTPVQAGRQAMSSPAPAAPPQPAPSEPQTAPSEPQTAPLVDDPAEPWGDLPVLPFNFLWEKGQLCLASSAKTGAPLNLKITPYPLYISGVQTGEAHGNRYTYVLNQWLPRKGWISISMPAGKLMGQSGMAELFDQGAIVDNRDAFRIYLVAAMALQHQQKGIDVKFDQFGWKADETAFLSGNRLYAGKETTHTVGSDEVNLRAQWIAPRPGAHLGEWAKAANQLFAAGNEPQAVALLASFAAPLMRFHATDEGGAVLSLVSRKSGTGKTTALDAAASVWGRMQGLSLTNIDTKVAKAVTLGVMGNLPVIYDELHNKDPEVVKDFIMTFTNGRDKMRGTVDGGIRHTSTSWQTLLLSASNRSIVDLVSSLDAIDAPGFRILELLVEAPAGRKMQDGDRLKLALERNCGVAGDAYLRYITGDALSYIKGGLPLLTADMWAQTKLEPQHRFWVRTISSIAMAAALVEKMGILEFSAQRITGWLLDQIAGNREDPAVPNRDSAIAALSEFLAEHVSNTLVVQHKFMPNKPAQMPLVRPVGKLYIRYETEPKRVYVREAYFREWLTKKGHGSRATFKTLLEKGIILQIKKYVTLSAGTEFPGGQIPCVEITSAHPEMSGILAPVERVMPSEIAA